MRMALLDPRNAVQGSPAPDLSTGSPQANLQHVRLGCSVTALIPQAAGVRP